VALRLARDDDGVERQEVLDQRLVQTGDRLAVRALGDLGPEDRVVLGERVLTLGLEVGLTRARDGVEEDRLFDRGDERVADAAEHRVIRPDRQVVLAGLRQLSRVVEELTLCVVRLEADALDGVRVDAPPSGLDVLRRDEGVGIRVPALLVDQPQWVEDLQGSMRVEGRDELADRPEIAIDELAQPAVVVDGPGARATGDEQLEAGDAEGVLDVDADEADAEGVIGRRPELVLVGPGDGRPRPFLVGHAPDLADEIGVVMRRERKLAHRTSLGSRGRLSVPTSGPGSACR
jgi:hypothetical protein